MEFLGLLGVVIYTFIAVFSLYMTYQERRRIGSDGLVYTLGAYLLCLFWPLPLLAIFVSMQMRSA